MDAASQYALAYALTTTAGVRALLPLAAFAVVIHLGFIHPPPGFEWLGRAHVMWPLIGVAVIELMADKVPVVDHLMHVLGVAVKPAAAAIIVGGSVHAQSPQVLAGLMALGALNALGVHAAVASVRGASTLTTAGIANPAISTVEDGGSILATVLAFFAPFIAAFLALCFAATLFVLGRSAYRRVRARKVPSTGSG
ncbi:MAG TPA: DUF4126 domain-containing protein [Candidatus Cybelea sp.]|nr:DUF4126 domain-containing protein [Candidatus Cybelea sp.]